MDFNALAKWISMRGLAEISHDLEGEWADEGNTVPFRMLCLRLLSRLTVFNSLTKAPVDGEFWESVLKSKSSAFRSVAILACNLSDDDRLWHCLKHAWHEDPNGLNRTLALETMGTVVSRNRQRTHAAMEEFQEAIERKDPWAKLGALYGSSFVKERSADGLAKVIVQHEEDGYLVATAFAILLKRKPGRGRKIFSAILGYILTKKPSVKVTTTLLGVCRLCDPVATRRVCLRAIEGSAQPQLQVIRTAAMNLMLGSALSQGIR
jgi:hypothetical protein